MKYQCTNCGNVVNGKLKFCPECRAKFYYDEENPNSDEKYKCPKCDFVFYKKLPNCPECRVRFDYDLPVVLPEEQPAPAEEQVEEQPVEGIVCENDSNEAVVNLFPDSSVEPVVEEAPKEIKEEPKKKKKGGAGKVILIIVLVLLALLILLCTYYILAGLLILPSSITDPVDKFLDYIPGFGKNEFMRSTTIKAYNWVVGLFIK